MYVPALPLSATQYLVAPPGATGPSYDRTAPRNIADYPKCATLAAHNTAHANCKPYVEVIRGLGLLDLAQANPCWAELLPLCPQPSPIRAAVPRAAVVAPKPAPAPVAPVPKPAVVAAPRGPVLVAAPPPVPGPVPVTPAPAPAPAPSIQPAQAGFTTGGLLAIAAAVGIGGWLLFGRKKKQSSAATA